MYDYVDLGDLRARRTAILAVLADGPAGPAAVCERLQVGAAPLVDMMGDAFASLVRDGVVAPAMDARRRPVVVGGLPAFSKVRTRPRVRHERFVARDRDGVPCGALEGSRTGPVEVPGWDDEARSVMDVLAVSGLASATKAFVAARRKELRGRTMSSFAADRTGFSAWMAWAGAGPAVVAQALRVLDGFVAARVATALAKAAGQVPGYAMREFPAVPDDVLRRPLRDLLAEGRSPRRLDARARALSKRTVGDLIDDPRGVYDALLDEPCCGLVAAHEAFTALCDGLAALCGGSREPSIGAATPNARGA